MLNLSADDLKSATIRRASATAPDHENIRSKPLRVTWLIQVNWKIDR